MSTISKVLRLQDNYYRDTKKSLNSLRAIIQMDVSKIPILAKADAEAERQRKMIELLAQSEQE